MLSAKFDEADGNLPSVDGPELQPSVVSRSALLKGQLNENNVELLLDEGIGL